MRIALWNANGLAQHKFELELFLKKTANRRNAHI